MHDPLVSHLKNFLKKQLRPKQGPLLLGFSGGTDSLALLHLLLACQKELAFELHLAHVDHGWREESGSEAKGLQKLAQQFSLPFHLRTLKKKNNSNLEAEGRKERLEFFKEIYQKEGCQALLLAHQADDQAETILKKVLEGTHFLALNGMKELSSLYGMRVLRPLLLISKKKLGEWLEKNQLVPIHDRTNQDPRFLRARMRTQILPLLSESFGKEVGANLLRLGETFRELSESLDGRIQEYLKGAKRGPLGVYLDVPASLSKLERSALIKKFLDEEELLLTHPVFDTICLLLEQGTANRTFFAQKTRLIVDRGILFILSASLWKFSGESSLTPKNWSCGNGEWEISHLPSSNQTSWRDFWSDGRVEVALPAGEYQVGLPTPTLPFPGQSPLKKWWGDHRVPAFLRPLLPVIKQNGNVVHEFLTGRNIITSIDKSLLHVSLKFKLNNNYRAQKKQSC